MMKKTRVQEYFQRFPRIYGDENTYNKCFCAEKCQENLVSEGKM